MPPNDRAGLKAAFAGFAKPADNQAEIKLLGRTVAENETGEGNSTSSSYQVATTQPSALQPRPLRHREALRQLSFRCPVALAAELRRKAAFNQLEHQEIIVEGIRRVLAELESPPPAWDPES
jgi:hypothetical protein